MYFWEFIKLSSRAWLPLAPKPLLENSNISVFEAISFVCAVKCEQVSGRSYGLLKIFLAAISKGSGFIYFCLFGVIWANPDCLWIILWYPNLLRFLPVEEWDVDGAGIIGKPLEICARCACCRYWLVWLRFIVGFSKVFCWSCLRI